MGRGFGVLGCCLTVVLALMFAAPSLAIDFSAHRALYRITLEKAPAGGVSEVSGNMSIDWENSCAGWTFEYRSIIEVTQSEGPSVRLATSATTWESVDGLQYRFNVRHSTNGRVLERLEGHATLEGPGKAGSVRFTEPQDKVVPLPAGTLFPMAHSFAIVKAAEARKPPIFLPYKVFDGMEFEGVYLVSTVIGRGGRPANLAGPAQALKGRRVWPVTLAYFKPGADSATPNHEIRLQMYDNGVSDDLVMDFSDFSVRARLRKLEILPGTVCDH